MHNSFICLFVALRFTFVLPVKESKATFRSWAMALPTSAPPLTVVQTLGGRPLATSTPCTIRDTAMLVRGVVGAHFLRRGGEEEEGGREGEGGGRGEGGGGGEREEEEEA